MSAIGLEPVTPERFHKIKVEVMAQLVFATERLLQRQDEASRECVDSLTKIAKEFADSDWMIEYATNAAMPVGAGCSGQRLKEVGR